MRYAASNPRASARGLIFYGPVFQTLHRINFPESDQFSRPSRTSLAVAVSIVSCSFAEKSRRGANNPSGIFRVYGVVLSDLIRPLPCAMLHEQNVDLRTRTR